jgi:3-hydroxy-D-aspartate aldolase
MAMTKSDGLEVGFDIPARPGMTIDQIATPCLVLDLNALEANIARMGQKARALGVGHRAHGKMHKSVDVANLQIRLGGAVGICCQKTSEAEAFVRGGIRDVLISNQVRDARMIDRLARLPLSGARISVCLDDPANVAMLSAAAVRHGTTIGCLVELECGAGRCGVSGPADALVLAQAISAAPGLIFKGLQAYHGAVQHRQTHAERAVVIAGVVALVQETVGLLGAHGLPCETVTGAGTGSFELEGASGIYTEIQCGSYAFMDADYGRIRDAGGRRLDATWENALFVLTQVTSHVGPARAVCDAGLKVMSGESGLPVVADRDGLTCLALSDEHCTIHDPGHDLSVGDRLRVIPGHCDPTCNLHDWYVGLRGDVVESLWPVTARGKAY